MPDILAVIKSVYYLRIAIPLYKNVSSQVKVLHSKAYLKVLKVLIM